jgi:hypothetical protein
MFSRFFSQESFHKRIFSYRYQSSGLPRRPWTTASTPRSATSGVSASCAGRSSPKEELHTKVFFLRNWTNLKLTRWFNLGKVSNCWICVEICCSCHDMVVLTIKDGYGSVINHNERTIKPQCSDRIFGKNGSFKYMQQYYSHFRHYLCILNRNHNLRI